MATKKTPAKKADKTVAALEKEVKAAMAKLAKAKAQVKKEAAKKPAAKKAVSAVKKVQEAKKKKKTVPKISKQDAVRMLVEPRKAKSKCVYCGSTKFGPGCATSLNKMHKHNTDEKRCMYCGKTDYGFGCLGAPTRRHIHGSGASKCKYCGKLVLADSMGCEFSPNRKHET